MVCDRGGGERDDRWVEPTTATAIATNDDGDHDHDHDSL